MWEILKDVTFSRTTALILVLLPALPNVFILYYLHFNVQPSDTARTFSFTIRALLVWQFRDFMFRISNSADTAYYWDNVLSSGYLVFAPLTILFSLKYAGYQRLAKNVGILFLLFLPALFFNSVYGLISSSVTYYLSPFWGWNHSYNETLTGKATAAWVFCCGIISCILLIRFAWKSRHVPVLATQSLLVAGGRSTLWIVAFITQFVLPQFLHKHVIPLTSTITVIFSLAVIIALRRYRLFQMLASEEQVENVDNYEIAQLRLSPDLSITHANPFANYALGLHCPGQPVTTSKILVDEPVNRQVFYGLISECLAGKLVTNKEVKLIYKKLGPEEETLSASPVYTDHKLESIVVLWRNAVR